MTVTDAAGRKLQTDRTLAMINYGLLFSAIFFAGVPGLVAMVIAFTQKDGAAPPVREHYRFQLQIFWIAFLLGLIAGICGLWALMDVAGQVWKGGHVVAEQASGLDIDLSNMDLTGEVIGLFIASLVSLGLMALWSLIAPAVGFIRLATAPAEAA
jgi:uncharacterized membrane protein